MRPSRRSLPAALALAGLVLASIAFASASVVSCGPGGTALCDSVEDPSSMPSGAVASTTITLGTMGLVGVRATLLGQERSLDESPAMPSATWTVTPALRCSRLLVKLESPAGTIEPVVDWSEQAFSVGVPTGSRYQRVDLILVPDPSRGNECRLVAQQFSTGTVSGSSSSEAPAPCGPFRR